MLEEDIDKILYKNVDFSPNRYLTILNTGKSLEAHPELIPLIDYRNKAGKLFPFVFFYKNQHLIIPTNLPSWYETSTYSLPFLDTFHHIFGHHKDREKLALLRLEDVNVHTYSNPEKLYKAHRHLMSKDIPYHIAFIERYIDPTQNIDKPSTDSKKFINFIKYSLISNQVYLIQHGYTHQYGNEISGIGFEFWDSQANSPIKFANEDDARAYTTNKINDAEAAMIKAELTVPDIWEFPHYQYSELDNQIINEKYPIRYESIPDVGFLPFASKINGTIYIPENLGYLHHDKQIQEKEILLKQLLTFEDPIASFFWHPWRDVNELKTMTGIIQDNDFKFTSAYSLLESNGATVTPAILNISKFGIFKGDILVYGIFIFFIIGGIVFIRNVFLVKKYIRRIKNFNISLDDVRQLANDNNVPLPKLALFVPARNEGLVIGNTIKRINKLDYPKDKLEVFIIVDERELEDNVERTTKEVALETAETVHSEAGFNFIKIVEVPKWYSGNFGSNEHTFGKSTKGRALNYCLQVIDHSDIDMIGILDADGRLHPSVLKEVAYNRIVNKSKLLQGPVFQVNNYNDVSIVGKTAGLELALHHLTDLPHRLNKKGKMQFLAGTNYFIDPTYITSAGGWDQTALVEDAEIALRLYIKDRIVGEWLNSPELEQSPANFSIYKKQRERWVRGHLDLLKQIKQSQLSFWDKFYLYQKILFSQSRIVVDVGLPIVAIYLMFVGGYQNLDESLIYLSLALFIVSIFIWDTYGFVFRTLKNYIDPSITAKSSLLVSLKHIVFLPVFIIVQAIPRVTALYKYWFDKNNNMWYKTERTAETPL